MLILLSPAKTLDYSSQTFTSKYTYPKFAKKAFTIAREFRKYSINELAKIMKVSDKIAQLTYDRFHEFSLEHTLKNSKQALLAFKGDVYTDIAVEQYSQADFDFAQRHVRILSGLYGILRPLDLMQPYRLEMHLKVKYWFKKLVDEIKNEKLLINLASKEYFASIDLSHFKGQVINVVFKEKKGGSYKIVALYAKRARGAMAHFIIKERILDVEELKHFTGRGYSFNHTLSDKNTLVFVREQ